LREIMTKKQLQQLAKDLDVRADWHEPDEQDVSVEIFGERFDNAGVADEISVYIIRNEKLIARVNLATLFAFACGTYEGDQL